MDERITKQQLHDERWSLLEQINRATDTPMIALSFVWLGLLILDFTQGLGPTLQIISNIIWGVFVLDFVLEFTIAPRKVDYLKRSWLTAISLVLPALRVLRIVRVVRLLWVARAARSLRLLRVVTSLNRGLRAVGNMFARRGIGYVIAITTLVTFGGAAGMYAFENPQALVDANYLDAAQAADGAGIASYGEAVWWTAMIMATMGSEYWPQTVEGRILGWLLALYAFAIFGYITATIASYFVGQDTAAAHGEDLTAGNEVAALRADIHALRAEVATLTAQLQGAPAWAGHDQAAATNGDRQRAGAPDAPTGAASPAPTTLTRR